MTPAQALSAALARIMPAEIAAVAAEALAALGEDLANALVAELDARVDLEADVLTVTDERP